MQTNRKGIRNFYTRLASLLFILLAVVGLLIGITATGVDYEWWHGPFSGASAYAAALACLTAAGIVFVLASPSKPKGPKKAVILPVSTKKPTLGEVRTREIFNQINGL